MIFNLEKEGLLIFTDMEAWGINKKLTFVMKRGAKVHIIFEIRKEKYTPYSNVPTFQCFKWKMKM